MKKILPLVLIVLACTGAALSQSPWKSKRCAVVLTYDDALNVHLDNAIPLLDSLGLKATFYLSVYYPGCKDRIAEWRKAASNGHELGNHTMFHPCIGTMPGREWVSPEHDLNKYSMQRFLEEVKMTNAFLEAVDGKKKRSFAYTCGDMTIRDTSFVEQIKNDVASARGVRSELIQVNKIDLYNVNAFPVVGQSGDELIALVNKALKENSLLVFLFHGVGGEHSLNVDLKAHRQLLKYLKANEKDIWIAPLWK